MNRFVTAAATALMLCASAIFASPSYTGYSGAPGSRGSCASSCHGSSGGTITASGFPASYAPGQAYLVSVVHRGGSLINNFNASVRIGTGSTTAGTITAGYLTSTYSRTQEPNGIHLSSEDRDSCTFTWTAPESSVGDVKLYLAGHQGSQGGANTDLVLTSSPATGVEEKPASRTALTQFSLSPSVVSSHAPVSISVGTAAPSVIRVVDRTGRVVNRVKLPGSDAGKQTVAWQPLDSEDRPLARGSYLLVLQSGPARLTRRLSVR